MGLEEEILREIEIWSKKLEEKLMDLKANNKDGESFIENITAYFKDSKYFLAKKDLIKAFEALIWSWSWLEIGLKFGFIKSMNVA
jgi:hypothetical protein